MKLPIGIYAISQCFEGLEGTVEFSFRGTVYQAQLGENAFVYLEDLEHISLQSPTEPFCGYEGMPIAILPAGLYKAGTVKETRFRTFLPCAMTLLGENAGISPNSEDLSFPNPQRVEETVFRGSFYFGAIALRGALNGTLTLDGLTIESAKVYDERTEAEFAGLTIKNCRFTGQLTYDLIRATALDRGKRVTTLSDCRLDGTDSCAGEGRLLSIAAGDLTVERLYFGNTDKFPGMTNYSRTLTSRVDSMLWKDCLFENCGSTHGLTFLPEADHPVDIRLQNCTFREFAPREDPALWMRMTPGSRLQLEGCQFKGAHTAPAILIDGDTGGLTLTDTRQIGYTHLYLQASPRRTEVLLNCNYPLADPHQALTADMAPLDTLYAGLYPFYCDFHCHSNSGGTSDGKTPIGEYVEGMKKLGVDCAAIVDHRQMLHYFLPQWDETYMICGSEPSTRLSTRENSFHYTMIFPDKTGLAQVMGAFPEFDFTGTKDGHFKHALFTPERFRELAEYIYSIGGLLSHAHPMQLPSQGQPEDYFLTDQIAFETIHADVNAYTTRQNYLMWIQLLNLGKRVRTHGSSDSHGPVSNRGLSTVYAEKHYSTDIFHCIRSGNCTAGGLGIQMSIDDCPMGSATDYAEGKRLYIRAGDFHFAHKLPNTVYCLKVYTEKGLAYAKEFDGNEPVSLILPVQQRNYYRCEVTNESDNLPVAFSNPIWLNEPVEG